MFMTRSLGELHDREVAERTPVRDTDCLLIRVRRWPGLAAPSLMARSARVDLLLIAIAL